MGNQKLENMLDEMRARTSEKKLPDDFIAMLKESDVIVPAIMPAGTDPEILHKLMEYSDKNMGLPPEANPQPCVLQNPAGQKYLPVFTSEEQVRNAPKESKFPLLMTMPFASCLQLLKQTEELSGIAVNPYSHNILFTPNAESKDGKKTVEVTIEQFHHLTRQRLESNYLPLQLFKRKHVQSRDVPRFTLIFVDKSLPIPLGSIQVCNLFAGIIACPLATRSINFAGSMCSFSATRSSSFV